jgi:hypothetical protein
MAFGDIKIVKIGFIFFSGFLPFSPPANKKLLAIILVCVRRNQMCIRA